MDVLTGILGHIDFNNGPVNKKAIKTHIIASINEKDTNNVFATIGFIRLNLTLIF